MSFANRYTPAPVTTALGTAATVHPTTVDLASPAIGPALAVTTAATLMQAALAVAASMAATRVASVAITTKTPESSQL